MLAGLGAASVAAVLYFLMKDDSKGKKKSSVLDGKDSSAAAGKSRVEDISKETVQLILKEIIESQEKMKVYMKDLTKELRSTSLSFEQTYQKVREVQPNDPLEKHNLSMMEFDQLLDKFQGDPTVREAIAKIMGAPSPSTASSEKVKDITVKDIIKVHRFMLEELKKLVETYQGMQQNTELDMKTVTIVAQAIVGANMEKKFNITSEDVESAVLHHHTMLSTDQEFATINAEIQNTMAKLMGSGI